MLIPFIAHLWVAIIQIPRAEELSQFSVESSGEPSLRLCQVKGPLMHMLCIMELYDSRIFQFENFSLTKKRVLRQKEDEGALVSKKQ